MFVSSLIRAKKTWIGVMVISGLIILLSGATISFAGQKVWEVIDWNEPKPWPERLLADRYVLPEGWEEATEGVEEIVVFNIGGLRGDIASVMNFMRFEELTGIRVTPVPVSPTVVGAKTLSTLITKDKSVDGVVTMDAGANLSLLANENWVTPVDHMWPPEVLKLYSPQLKNYITYDGHMWGLRGPSVAFVDWYRPSWLVQAGVAVPDTWEEYYTAAQKCRTWGKQNLGESYYGITFVGGTLVYQLFQVLPYTQGKRLFENGKYQFSSPEFKKAFKMATSFITEDIASQEVLTYSSPSEPAKVFGMGKSAFMTAVQPSFYVSLARDYPAIADDLAIFPAPKWSAKDPESYRGGRVAIDLYLINNSIDDGQKAAMMLWGDYARSMEAKRNELIVEGNESLLLDLWKDVDAATGKVDWDLADRAADSIGLPHYERIESIPAKDARRLTVQNAKFELYPPGFPQVADKIVEFFSNAALGKISSDEACEEIQKFAEQTLP